MVVFNKKISLLKPVVVICAVFFYTSLLVGQEENNHWYFGRNAGIDFNVQPPAFEPGGQVDRSVSTVVSDASGALLFYTDGRRVWDRLHRVMPNGEGLLSAPNRPQSVAVVPVVRQPGQYYLFTISSRETPGNLRYSIVDLNRNGGFGEVIPDKKNINLKEGYYPAMTTIKAECGVWLIAHSISVFNANVFDAYLIDHEGIDFPVRTSHSVINRGEDALDNLIMKSSPDGNSIALAASYRYETNQSQEVLVDDYLVAFRFFKNDGKVLTHRRFDTPEIRQEIGGLHFSPDSRLLYVNERSSSDRRSIFQYDLSSGDPEIMVASRQEVGMTGDDCPDCIGDIAIGPDQRLYVARNRKEHLGVIAFPDRAGPDCNYIDQGFFLAGSLSGPGLPNHYTPNFQVEEPLPFRDTLLCRAGEIRVSAAAGFSAYRWQDGQETPAITISEPGQYRLEAMFHNCPIRDTIDAIDLIEMDGLLGPDTTLCPGEALVLDASAAGGSDYLWNDGLAASQRSITEAGEYWVEYSDGQCPVRDYLRVENHPTLSPELGPDHLLCQGEQLTLQPDVNALGYSWQDGSSSPQFTVTGPGLFWVSVTGPGGCVFRDSVRIDQSALQPVDLGPDLTLCEGQATTLTVEIPPNSFARWQEDLLAPALTVNRSGTYSVEVSDGNCSFRDEISIEVRDCCTLFIPNAFSPNGDGINDRFRIGYGCAPVEYRLRVFSRQGQQLFETTDIADGWDGNFGGRNAPQGVYLYLIDYRFEKDGEMLDRQEAGDVILVR